VLITIVLFILHWGFAAWTAQCAGDAFSRGMNRWGSFFVVLAILNGLAAMLQLAQLDQLFAKMIG